MSRKAYLYNSSLAAHKDMVRTYARAMEQHWDKGSIHLSCDTAVARGIGQSRLEIGPMVAWDAFIGSRQITELHLPPNQRHYHRYLPFPETARDSLDEHARPRIAVCLHHQLLTGVVIHVDPRSFTRDELGRIECSVVHKRILLLASGQYWRARINVAAVTSGDDASLVESLFEQIWEARKSSEVMQLYYRYPHTFDSRHFVPEGVRRFLVYLQNGRCPCQDCCDLSDPRVSYHIDHIVPKEPGGSNVLINLQATCAAYNSGRKRDRPEARTVSYANVWNDPDWKPQLSRVHTRLLLNQCCHVDHLKAIQGLQRQDAKKAIE